MPRYMPRLNLGMPPLPFTDTEPFTALKQKPDGGVAHDTNISGIGSGGFKLATVKGSSGGNRKANRVFSQKSAKIKIRKAPSSKERKANNATVKKKSSSGMFSPAKGGQKKLKRLSNGRFGK
jgi:hypothetical protein